jgi:hypothetical protein
MSDTWFNLRVLLWHIQILKGRLIRPIVAYNPFWWKRELLWKPIWLHTFEPKVGWQERNSDAWIYQANKGN